MCEWKWTKNNFTASGNTFKLSKLTFLPHWKQRMKAGVQEGRAGQGEKRSHISRDEDGDLHLISPSVLHMCSATVRSKRERESSLLNGNSCASATAAVWHFRWPRFPLYSPLELAQTTMASHQKRRQEYQTLLSVAVEISVQGGKGGMRPLASLPCQPAFYYWKHSHTHTHNCLQLSANSLLWYLFLGMAWHGTRM